MKKYKTPEVNIIWFGEEDILTSSVAPDYVEGLSEQALAVENRANIDYNSIEAFN
ncbi:MAG: hypothetical protein IJT23_08075 [Clostridia bacterium]|nr:hypothetical protein [Clostridia bacterium]